MAKINLLPWREERRQELKRQFFVILGGAAIIGAGIVYLAETRIQAQIAQQKARNNFILAEEKRLDESITEIKELKKQREQLIGRMEVIQNLQGNRSIIVHMFDEVARTVPDGIYLQEVEKKGRQFSIKGNAEANNRISNYMRNLNGSEWFTNPNLAEVKAKDNSEQSSFHLSVEEFSPKADESEEEES